MLNAAESQMRMTDRSCQNTDVGPQVAHQAQQHRLTKVTIKSRIIDSEVSKTKKV